MSEKSTDKHAAEILIYGFQPVLDRLRQDPSGIFEIYLDLTRRDARARDLVHQARDNGGKLAQVERPTGCARRGSASASPGRLGPHGPAVVFLLPFRS